MHAGGWGGLRSPSKGEHLVGSTPLPAGANVTSRAASVRAYLLRACGGHADRRMAPRLTIAGKVLQQDVRMAGRAEPMRHPVEHMLTSSSVAKPPLSRRTTRPAKTAGGLLARRVQPSPTGRRTPLAVSVEPLNSADSLGSRPIEGNSMAVRAAPGEQGPSHPCSTDTRYPDSSPLTLNYASASQSSTSGMASMAPWKRAVAPC